MYPSRQVGVHRMTERFGSCRTKDYDSWCFHCRGNVLHPTIDRDDGIARGALYDRTYAECTAWDAKHGS